MGERRTQQPDSENHAWDENDRDEESLVEKKQPRDKMGELVDAPRGAEYDEGKTNPVTGERRD